MSTLAPPPPTSGTPPAQPPSPNSQGGPGLRLKRALAAAFTSRAVLRPVSAVLRRHAPILKLGKRVVVSRHADVLELLTRDQDFTIHEVNGPSIDRINGPFILEMDRGPTYDRDHGVLRSVARYDDLDRVRALARDVAARGVEAARPHHAIEAVQGLTRAVPTELVARYFGFPGPDPATMQRWLRSLFQDAFLDSIDDPFVRQAALASRAEIEAWLPGELARRRAAGVADADDVLGRMLALQGPERPWLDDDWVRRNICGLVVGAVETTSRFSVLALEELFARPQELAGAVAAANAGDLDAVRQYAWEAVRFNPHTPLIARFCPRDTVLAAGTPRERKIAGGSTMLVDVVGASFDGEAVPDPDRFRTDREIRSYLHFGWGMHQCFGLAMNTVTIPEILAALLRLPGLRRAPGAEGKVVLDGPFPNRWMLAFD